MFEEEKLIFYSGWLHNIVIITCFLLLFQENGHSRHFKELILLHLPAFFCCQAFCLSLTLKIFEFPTRCKCTVLVMPSTWNTHKTSSCGFSIARRLVHGSYCFGFKQDVLSSYERQPSKSFLHLPSTFSVLKDGHFRYF